MDHSEFKQFSKSQEHRLLINHGPDKKDMILNEFNQLKKIGNNESQNRSLLNALYTVRDESFGKSWAPIRKKLKNLVHFIASFAIIFVNTSTVEGDFSIINYEKKKNRQAMLNLSSEGIFVAKQFTELEKMLK